MLHCNILGYIMVDVNPQVLKESIMTIAFIVTGTVLYPALVGLCARRVIDQEL